MRAALVILLLLAACTSAYTPKVVSVSGDAGATVLQVSVDSCNQNPQVTAEETDTEVRVQVQTVERQQRRDDCLDSVELTLNEPLGSRTVVDATTGAELEVLPLGQ